jgi:hypothetical protein
MGLRAKTAGYLTCKWVRLGSFHQSSVSSLQSLVYMIKSLAVFLLVFKMGSFVQKR